MKFSMQDVIQKALDDAKGVGNTLNTNLDWASKQPSGVLREVGNQGSMLMMNGTPAAQQAATEDAGMLNGQTEMDAAAPAIDYFAGKAANLATNTTRQAIKNVAQAHANAKLMPGGLQAGFVKVPGKPPPFKNFTDLSTKTLGALDGKAEIPKNELVGLLNKPGIKGAEKDMFIPEINAAEGNKIPVQQLADTIYDQLLPLSRTNEHSYSLGEEDYYPKNYENVNLPGDQRGLTTNYQENLYESPIQTQAGEVHFPSQAPGYFGHTRTEDLKINNPATDELSYHKMMNDNYSVDNHETGEQIGIVGSPDEAKAFMRQYRKTVLDKAPTRRLLEVQSDLFQKGRLGNETQTGELPSEILNNPDYVHTQRTKDLAKLEAYKNIWHERLIQHEIQQAAQDGIKNLDVPTGDTAMKIEGLGERAAFHVPNHIGENENWRVAAPGDIKPGAVISDDNYDNWIVTKDHGDGTFRAIPNLTAENEEDIYRNVLQKHQDENGDVPDLSTIKFTPSDLKILDKYAEEKDISGKVDTSNPIHQFYEKTVADYIKKHHGAVPHTDEQGVTWNRIPITPEHANKPVNAFNYLPPIIGAGAVGTGYLQQQSQQ